MSGLRAWIKHHPLVSFLAVAFGFSWGLWAVMLSQTGHINWAGSFGPTVAAIAVVGISQGRSGLKNLLRPILAWRFGAGWYFFIFIGCILIFVLGLWAYTLLGGALFLPREAIMSQLVLVPLYYLIVFFIGGPLGEEIGWRGFLLPHLLKHNNGLIASVIVFIFWFAWHLPLFWLPGASQYGSPLGPYVIFIAVWSILFTWVFVGTSGSLLSVLLLHTTINTFSLFLAGVDPTVAEGPAIVYGGAVSALLALVVLVMNKRVTRTSNANTG